MDKNVKSYFRKRRAEIHQILTDNSNLPLRRLVEKMIFQLDELIQDVRLDFNKLERGFFEKKDPVLEKKIKTFERELTNVMNLRWEVMDWLDKPDGEKLPIDFYILWLNTDTLFAFINLLKKSKFIEDRSSWDIIKEHFSPDGPVNRESINWLRSKECLAYMIWNLEKQTLIACRDLWAATESHFALNGEVVENLDSFEQNVWKITDGNKTDEFVLIDQIIASVA